MPTCASCGQENPAGFRLCGMCGAPLQETPRARAERKVVTVLFCDLVGSTARAERLDPEDVRAIAEEFLTESERIGRGYADVFVCAFRAAILVARGEVDRADADSREAVELARHAGDPQALQPAYQRRAQVELELGATADARRHARQANVELARVRLAIGFAELVLLALRLDVEDELSPVVAALERLPWIPIARKLLAHEYVDAADDLERFGDRPAEAAARMLAAERFIADGRRADADLQLQKALAIYRSVGATRYVRQAETLLAAPA
jgi:tetratricopeptide (TPR) repeat protein